MSSILYSGPLNYGQTCEMRRRALERLAYNTIKVDYTDIFLSKQSLLKKVQWFTRFGPMIDKYNKELLMQLEINQPDIVWADKSIFIYPEFFKEAKSNCVKHIIHYSPDNYFIKQNNSRYFWKSLPYFTLVVTTKESNVEPLLEKGAKKVFLSGNAFDPTIHKPIDLTKDEYEKYKSDVSFIGRWEPNREVLMQKLIEVGFDIKIWGGDWKRAKNKKVNSRCTFHSPLGLEYAKVINASKINLGLLSRLAEDNITQRSIEIPACGAFMLAERSQEHLDHFIEEKEAEFFSNYNELIEKIMYYLANDNKRKEIAKNGRERCLTSQYSYDERMKDILQQIIN